MHDSYFVTLNEGIKLSRMAAKFGDFGHDRGVGKVFFGIGLL
jgi:hypothetical protein